MAKAKKKENLSLEEKLERALVPVEEQPYEVPENWCWTTWGNLGDFVAGNGFKNEYQGYTEYEIPFYKVGSLKYADEWGYLYDESNTITEVIREKLKATLIPRNSILFAKIGEAIRLNRRCLNKKECCIDNNMMAFITHQCNFRYMYYWTMGQRFYCLANATTVPAIRKSDLETIKFPLAPVKEQQRIVEKIERLFAKLDKAKEKVRGALHQSKLRTNAVLNLAFEGKLSNKWRHDNNVSLTSWSDTTIGNVLEYVKDKYDPMKGVEINIPYIGLEHMKRDFGIVSQGFSNEIRSTKNLFQKGDILYGKLRPYLNKHDIASLDGMCSTDIIVYRASNEITARFVNYLFSTSKFINYAVDHSKGINLPRISEKIVSNYMFRIPTIQEQEVIVDKLDRLLLKEKQIEEIVNVTLDKIGAMEKAILAKAFRGKLGTNNTDEEGSIELLKQILNDTDR